MGSVSRYSAQFLFCIAMVLVTYSATSDTYQPSVLLLGRNWDITSLAWFKLRLCIIISATHPNGEHAKIGAWCGPLNDTERYLSMIDPEEEVLNHQFQLPTPSSQADGGSTTVTSGKYAQKLQHQLLSWWRHQMEIFSALLTICAGNSPVPGEFPAQKSVMWLFDVLFYLGLNKRLSKPSWRWWFETLSHPLWRHHNFNFMITMSWHNYYKYSFDI